MSAIYVNSIKDKTNTRELASDSGSAWSWGSGLPSGSIVQVQSTQLSSATYSMTSMSINTDYVLQNQSVSSASGGSHSGILDVNITPKITGSKIWLQSHVMGELNTDNAWNCMFFFWRSVGSTHTKLAYSGSHSSNVGHVGITAPTRSYHTTEQGSTPEIVNMQYFDAHGVSAGTQITYKVGITSSTSSITQWTTNKTITASNEVGVSSICAIELAP